MTLTGNDLFSLLEHVKLGGNTCLYTLEKCQTLAPLINEINRLKKEKNAIILAHSYVAPEIIVGVADFVGDSYELSKNAKQTDANTIVFAAVKFMAETAKLLNPTKQVLIPSQNNGCTLADSITGTQVVALRQKYPEYTFVCYINTSADVKAACDVCVTSSNVYTIVEALNTDKIYFLPDRLMGENLINEMIARGIKKTIKLWDGTCYVHEDYNPDMIDYIRLTHPDVKILSHPECSQEVLKKSDFVGSTSQLVRHVKSSNAPSFFMLTECGLTSRLQTEEPTKNFVGTCTMCRYMKSNQLTDILRVLTSPDPQDIITLEPGIQTSALNCINQMFHYTEKQAVTR